MENADNNSTFEFRQDLQKFFFERQYKSPNPFRGPQSNMYHERFPLNKRSSKGLFYTFLMSLSFPFFPSFLPHSLGLLSILCSRKCENTSTMTKMVMCWKISRTELLLSSRCEMKKEGILARGFGLIFQKTFRGEILGNCWIISWIKLLEKRYYMNFQTSEVEKTSVQTFPDWNCFEDSLFWFPSDLIPLKPSAVKNLQSKT